MNVWRVLSLMRTYCPAEAAVERAISLLGTFTSSMHDMEDTHALSMCMVLHCDLPPAAVGEGQGVEVARKLAANARFGVRPRHRVSQRIAPRASVEAAMLQSLEVEAAVADHGDILPSFWGWRCHWLAKAQHTNRQTDKPCLRTLCSNQMVVQLCMVATVTCSLSEGAWSVECACSPCASGATHVWFATHALSKIQDLVLRQWCRLWMMQPRLPKLTVKRKQWHHGSPSQSVPWRVHRPSWYVPQRQAHCVNRHALASVTAWVPWV